jgi:hypothetical protein
MKTRLLGAALATAWFMSILGTTAWAQGRGGGHHAGANGGERTAGGRGQAQPRSGAGSQTRTATAPATTDRSREDGQRNAAPRIVSVNAPRLFFSQPYYAFRPRQHVGFSVYLGYPVAYPSLQFYSDAYLYPNGYDPYTLVTPMYPYTTTPTYPYASAAPTYPYTSPTPTYPTLNPTYGYPAPGAITMAPGGPSAPATGGAPPPAVTGGVSFEITPGDAAVFVDGVYVGTAKDFSSTAPPLLLAAGRHHFELRAQSFQSMAFDVDVTPGQVVPYQGTMQP